RPFGDLRDPRRGPVSALLWRRDTMAAFPFSPRAPLRPWRACAFAPPAAERRAGVDHPGLQGWRDDLLRRRRPIDEALPRRGVGAARARRARAVREAVPRGVPERAGLDHDPAQAR